MASMNECSIYIDECRLFGFCEALIIKLKFQSLPIWWQICTSQKTTSLSLLTSNYALSPYLAQAVVSVLNWLFIWINSKTLKVRRKIYFMFTNISIHVSFRMSIFLWAGCGHKLLNILLGIWCEGSTPYIWALHRIGT